MNDRKLNLIIGWICFLISFIVYYLTAEPTVGFWDTGEYITTSAKLQVGHPPGAPLYQMLGAIFSIFGGVGGIHENNAFCCGDGYFGQKKIAEKVRKLRQNVNRDKSA